MLGSSAPLRAGRGRHAAFGPRHVRQRSRSRRDAPRGRRDEGAAAVRSRATGSASPTSTAISVRTATGTSCRGIAPTSRRSSASARSCRASPTSRCRTGTGPRTGNSRRRSRRATATPTRCFIRGPASRRLAAHRRHGRPGGDVADHEQPGLRGVRLRRGRAARTARPRHGSAGSAPRPSLSSIRTTACIRRSAATCRWSICRRAIRSSSCITPTSTGCGPPGTGAATPTARSRCGAISPSTGISSIRTVRRWNVAVGELGSPRGARLPLRRR